MSRKTIISCDGCDATDETNLCDISSYPERWARVRIGIDRSIPGLNSRRIDQSHEFDLCPKCIAALSDLPMRLGFKGPEVVADVAP